MSSQLHVSLGSRSYPIHIGGGLLDRMGALCAAAGLGRRALLVTDSQVGPLHAAPVLRSLAAAGVAVERFEFPAGETSKNARTLDDLWQAAAGQRLDRSAFIVALGGGVTGDLAGFAAATYMRGVAYVQAPTTLLAMVDSSVGGKTGINLPQGKNLVGAFHQPRLVVADLDTLRTLPVREYRAGLAEAVKYGVIRDAELFARLEREAAVLRDGLGPAGADIVRRCCEIKAEVVGADEREGGERAVLNFGHTLGHAVENAAGYGRFLHGEAVAVGMAYAARLSVRLTDFPAAAAARLEQLLVSLGLPARAPGLAWRELRAAMDLDKKSRGQGPRFVLARRLGAVEYGCPAAEDVMEGVWHEFGE